MKEYNTLVSNKTFIDEKPIKEVGRAIPLGETLRYKRDGIRKSRMYVQGFRQVPGIDFDLSYSPTISHGGFRLFCAFITWRSKACTPNLLGSIQAQVARDGRQERLPTCDAQEQDGKRR